jgi:Spermidine synthase
VTVHVDDGRSFVRRTDRRYDLVVYALVDSLVLHSGFSSIPPGELSVHERAFADIRRILKPDGVFVAYNFYRQPWLVGGCRA